jgi:hypothetical protein
MRPTLSLLVSATAALLAMSEIAGATDTKPSCAIVGDSIAVGVGQYMRSCRVNAKIGISSSAVIDRVDRSADVNVVSAGSNDPDNPNLRANLERIRSHAKRTVWILPVPAQARAAVEAVAAAHGDAVVSFTPSADRLHPRSEAALARSIAASNGLPQ